jgi:hypothetical protein
MWNWKKIPEHGVPLCDDFELNTALRSIAFAEKTVYDWLNVTWLKFNRGLNLTRCFGLCISVPSGSVHFKTLEN